jgi:uncharacterized protein involved in exopolysaccharide biosynthesis
MKTNIELNSLAKSSWTQKISKKYPWISLLLVIVLGGVVGYLCGFFLPPIYEAKAVLTTNIDIKENRPVITEIMVDSQLNYIGQLMFNPKIIDPLLSQEAGLGNPIKLEDLEAMSSIERQLMNTIIKVHGKDPAITARIATSWAKLAFETLLEAKSHVLTIAEANQELSFIESCFPSKRTVTEDVPTKAADGAFCDGLSYETARTQLDEATKILNAEETKTLGLTTYINVSQFIPASLPINPSSNNQGMMTLSGMIIGIVVGIIFIDIRWHNKSNEN